MPTERKGAVKFKGNPLTLVGPELKPGSTAPEFGLLAKDLSVVKLSSFKGKTVLLNVVPSLDTPVCSLQTKRFDEEAAKFPASIVPLTVSVDLPFAQTRFCGAEKVDKIQCLSDHRDTSFGQAYGVLIKELRLLARSIFVVDPSGKISYAEYVPEVTSHPNYDKALDALKQTAGK